MQIRLISQIHSHGNDLKSLHRHIPREILPLEYGGSQGAFDNHAWREQIINDEDYFTRLETYSSEPKQRIRNSESKTGSPSIKNSINAKENGYKIEK